MEFNITNYLTEEEIRSICVRAAESAATNAVTKILRGVNDLHQILTNVAYRVVWEKVDESFPEGAEEFITQKIPGIIENLGTYQVFRPRDAWENETSKGYVLLNKAIEASEGMIVDRVHELIASIDLYAIQDRVNEMIEEAIAKLGQKEVAP